MAIAGADQILVTDALTVLGSCNAPAGRWENLPLGVFRRHLKFVGALVITGIGAIMVSFG